MDDGQWLIEHRRHLDQAEGEWLEHLAQFDRDGLWELDGSFSCVQWLVWQLKMARSTAFEKVRVAHELLRRPVVAQALRSGRISYSAARAITRMDRPSPEVDEALVEVAASREASILDLERMVRTYWLYADQDRPPPEDPNRPRDVRIVRGEDGTGQVIATLSETETEEFAAAFQAFLDLRYRPEDGAAGDESSAEDTEELPGEEAPLEQCPRNDEKANALMDLIRTALGHAADGHAAGDDRYMVHLVAPVNGGPTTLLDGRPIRPADAAMIRCDSSTVLHLVGDGGEPLNLGRKTRDWNQAQRRAISRRDGGHCRFPGCHHRHYDIHHIQAWEDGGLTDLINGVCQCRVHHRMLHSGYRIVGDPDDELLFYRPDGTCFGSTYPTRPKTLVGV